MIRRRAGGNNCAGDPDISRGVTMRAGARPSARRTRPLWPLKLSQTGEIGSTSCGLHPPGDLRFRQPEHLLIAAGVRRTVLITIGPVRQRDARPFHP